jgi:cytidylate kinase
MVSGLPWYASRQVTFEREQRASDQGATAPAGRLGPYIVISRQTGAGGAELAAALGQHFGWPVLDKQLIDQMSARFHVDHDVLEMLDENKSGALYEVLGHFIDHRLISQNAYVCYLRRIVVSAATAGPAVFVGHGANFFLPRQRGLAVRVVAEERDRSERIIRKYGVSKLKAKQILAKAHDQRSAFIRSYFHRDVEDPENYDLVVNTSRLGVEAAAELIAAAFHSRQITDLPSG